MPSAALPDPFFWIAGIRPLQRGVMPDSRFVSISARVTEGSPKIEVSATLESIDDGFSLHDPNDHLILWDQNFANFLSHAQV